MKKHLIALAALAATGAFAQSSVTMYGIVDVGYGTHTTEAGNGVTLSKTSGVMTGSLAGSRIGFRGTEDMGGGMKANFVLEQGVQPTNSNAFNQRVSNFGHQIPGTSTETAQTNRQTYVGVSGGFGEVRLGYQYTNSYDLVAFQGLSFWEYQGGNFQNAAHVNGTRANGITYISPKMSGLQVKVQMGGGNGPETQESSTDTATGYRINNTRYSSLMLDYSNGPVYVGLAHSRAAVNQTANAAASTNIFGGAVAVPTVSNTATRDGYANHIGASYDFGKAKLTYVWGRSDNGGSATSTNTTIVTAQQLGLAVPVTGALTLNVSTGMANTESAGTTSKELKGNTIGATYAMSKRTKLYAFIGSETDAKQEGLAGSYRDSKTVLGINHSF